MSDRWTAFTGARKAAILLSFLGEEAGAHSAQPSREDLERITEEVANLAGFPLRSHAGPRGIPPDHGCPGFIAVGGQDVAESPAGEGLRRERREEHGAEA